MGALRFKRFLEILFATCYCLACIFGCRLPMTPSARMHAFSKIYLIDCSLDLRVLRVLFTAFLFLHSRNRHIRCALRRLCKSGDSEP